MRNSTILTLSAVLILAGLYPESALAASRWRSTPRGTAVSARYPSGVGARTLFREDGTATTRAVSPDWGKGVTQWDSEGNGVTRGKTVDGGSYSGVVNGETGTGHYSGTYADGSTWKSRGSGSASQSVTFGANGSTTRWKGSWVTGNGTGVTRDSEGNRTQTQVRNGETRSRQLPSR